MSSERILVLNAGSSSLKFAQFAVTDASPAPGLAVEGQVDGIGIAPRFRATDHTGAALPGPDAQTVAAIVDHGGALAVLLDWMDRNSKTGGTGQRDGSTGRLRAAGHRVVHGGGQFHQPVRITEDVLDTLATFRHLAPHHQPHNVAAIRALMEQHPDLPQVACFDTAFHASQPAAATCLSLPAAYRDKGLRRYGFHGLSYEYVTSAFAEATGTPLPARTVIAHLGNGASMCAVEDGRSIATTMGFSTLDGLMMGTRCGAIDPGVLIHLIRTEGMDLDALEDLLYNRTGLLGASGISADMRVLLASPEPCAKTAIDQYVYRIARELGSLAAALGGLDALIFTGGIGENAAPVRAAVIRSAAWLGFELDESANAGGGPRLTRSAAPFSGRFTGRSGDNPQAFVVATDEQAVIARHCCRVLGLSATPAKEGAGP